MTSRQHPNASPHHLILDASPKAMTLPHLLDAHQLRLFYGDLHNHTGYSDGTGSPDEALRQMRARGLHFAAITDHGEFFDRDTQVGHARRWDALARQVAALSDEEFVAIRGFEWSSPRQGHSNVWCSATYTGYHATGDHSMLAFYEWLAQAQAEPEAQVLASFNHPGREVVCFDGCAYVPAVDDRLVVLECFNRDEEYGDAYFRALDRGWHVGAIGVSDHHGRDWGNPAFPRAGVFAPALTLPSLQAALIARRVFATRSPHLMFLVTGNEALMGSRLDLKPHESLTIGVWCHDPPVRQGRTRLELWTSGSILLTSHETRGLQQVCWSVTIKPHGPEECWFIVRLLHRGAILAYSSPIWVRWS
ncbi:MAG TPA: CehA/McbA family metallohydrolase [Alphaproteobacteria bacterium]|nr:CehA/McbA family metallohydrolase [Alphaproteobacteria bacterium]